jgi:hypothetical protein
MCGKPNPDDLEVCQFCQARLKPLLAPEYNQPHAKPAAQPPQPAETAGETQHPAPAEPTPPPREDVSDWVQSLRTGEDLQAFPEEEPEDRTEESLEKQASPRTEEIDDDWLSSTREGKMIDTADFDD